MPCAGGLFNFRAGSAAYSLKPEDYDRLPLFAVVNDNRLLNEFAFYCLKRLDKLQNFGARKLTCNDDAGVRAHFAQKYAAIPATATLPAVPESYWYSKELVAYIMAILSTVAYHKSGDPRITGVMDEAYAAALKLFRGMTAQAFNDYIVRRMATYLESWPVDVKPAPAAELAPAAAPDGGGGGGDGGEAEGDDDGVMLAASDNEEPTEEEAPPPGTQASIEGAPGTEPAAEGAPGA